MSLKTCANGHQFQKSSNCPVCPICERKNKSENDFKSLLSAPVRRALERNGVETIEHLAKYSLGEILTWHGVGPASLPILRKALQMNGLSFKE